MKLKKWQEAMNRTSAKLVKNEKTDLDLILLFKELDRRLTAEVKRGF